MGIGNPISPRVAAVSELILTVSTQASCYFDFMQPGTKDLQKTQENGLANFKKPQRFACQTPKTLKPLHPNNIRLAYSVISML
jgi:hypothetical protein